MNKCPICGFNNSQDSEYCEACGTNLKLPPKNTNTDNTSFYKDKDTNDTQNVNNASNNYNKSNYISCPKCGRSIPLTNSYCTYCGTTISNYEKEYRSGNTSKSLAKVVSVIIYIFIIVLISIIYAFFNFIW